VSVRDKVTFEWYVLLEREEKMAFAAAASAGAILSLPLARAAAKEDHNEDEDEAVKNQPQSLVAEQDQLEAWTAAALGLPNPSKAPPRPEEEYYLHVS